VTVSALTVVLLLLELDVVPPQPAKVMAATEMAVRASLRVKDELNIGEPPINLINNENCE
jgi:hypothetical protein